VATGQEDTGGERMGLRVLVVDDSATVRANAEKILKRAGCEVRSANDGFEALASVAEYRPDLIFLDVMMPRLSGYEACQLIKRNGAMRQTPVVMFSSKDGIFDIARGRICGAEDYITKPFSEDDLLGAVRKYFPDLAQGNLGRQEGAP
jgi:twitching motility two-component system response regulator PilG